MQRMGLKLSSHGHYEEPHLCPRRDCCDFVNNKVAYSDELSLHSIFDHVVVPFLFIDQVASLEKLILKRWNVLA